MIFDNTRNTSPNTVKITFSGDIMCDMDEIPAYKTKTGEYDFSDIFNSCKDFFLSSDFVVGNLETPIANSEYSYERIVFNSPVEFAEAIKANGISMVTTANNHCLDRGVSGLTDTISNLDTVGLKHTGLNNKNILPTGIIEKIGDMKIGFLSYTYGTNACYNNNYLGKNEKWKVNLYQEQELYNPIYRCFYNLKFSAFIRKAVNYFSRRFLFHRNIFCPPYERTEKKKQFLQRMNDDINALKNSGAEYIIMCLHAGGQYNPQPIRKTKRIIAKIVKFNLDSIIINHEHVIHYGEILSNNKIVAYSLGNFTSLRGTNTPPFDKKAEYSLLLHLYLSKDKMIVQPFNITFTIAKTISVGKNKVKTVLLFDLIKKCDDENKRKELLFDNLKIYNLFRNSNEKDIELKLEYSL